MGRSETHSQSNHQQRESTNVGSTSETSSRQRNQHSQTWQQSPANRHSPPTPLSRNARNSTYNQNQPQNQPQPQYSPTNHGTTQNGPHRGSTHNFGNYANNGHNMQNVRCNYRNGHNSGQQWTSTPRDGSNYRSVNFNTTADGTINSSLVTLLDNHRRVQQDTTQALSKIIQLQDTKSNDVYINDLPKFSGEPQQFLDWILKVEKIARLTHQSYRELAEAKSEGAIFMCLWNISHNASWDECKLILRENFSNLQTKQHISSFLIARAQ